MVYLLKMVIFHGELFVIRWYALNIKQIMGVSRNPFTLGYTPVRSQRLRLNPPQSNTPPQQPPPKGEVTHWSYGFPRFVALSENGIYTYTIIYPQNGHFDGGHDDGLVSLGVPFFRQTIYQHPTCLAMSYDVQISLKATENMRFSGYGKK